MMKSLVSVLVLVGLVHGAIAAPSYIQRDNLGGYNVTYDYTDKAKTGFYVGGRLGVGFLNIKNKYSSNYSDVNASFDNDSYSFEPVLDGSIYGGYRIKYFWRAELEAGYLGQFSDKDNGFEYAFSAPYLLANGYYDFTNGLYVGAGVGMAFPMTKLDGAIFESGDREKTSVSPMAGIMLGWSHQLDYNMVLDVRYRLAGLAGHTQQRSFMYNGIMYSFENKNSMILDNSISFGLRYEF